MSDDDLGERSPKQQAGLDDLAKALFGRTQTDARKQGICVQCSSDKMKIQDFKDKPSIAEAKITGFCQKCQDIFFGEEE